MLVNIGKWLAVLTSAALASGIVISVHPVQTVSAGSPFTFQWSGTPAGPQAWVPKPVNDWDLLVHDRDVAAGGTYPTMQAAHGADCSPYPSTHVSNDFDTSVFICNNHVMTANNSPGYGEIEMTPAQVIDWSSSTVVINFNLTTQRTTNRDWVDVNISPFTSNVVTPIDRSVDLEGLAWNDINCGMFDAPPTVWMCKSIVNGVETDYPMLGNSVEGALQGAGQSVSETTRITYELDISQNHIRYGLPAYNNWFADANISLPFSSGIVQLGHHDYDDGKDCTASSYVGTGQPAMCTNPQTWHWSNFSISSATPFTMMRLNPTTNRPAGGGSTVLAYPLPLPAPSGSFLRFSASANTIQFSTNGGATWTTGVEQQATDMNNSSWKSYFMPIAAGTTTVMFQGQDLSFGPWLVQDPSVWSLNFIAPNAAPRAALPAVSNAAYGGYTTTAYVQNVGTATASAEIAYFDSNGVPIGTGDFGTIPVNGTWIVTQSNGNSFRKGGAGSAVVLSDQPVVTTVNEFPPGGGDATSYSGLGVGSGTGSTLFAPAIANGAYGGYTTGIGLINSGATPTNITVTYRDTSGSVVKTQPVSNVLPNAYLALYSGDPALGLPAGFSGTATIASSGSALAGVVNETGPGGQFSSYDAIPAGAPSLVAPVALRNAFGGFNTGTAIQNTSGTAGTVTITYYNGSGSSSQTSHPIAANGYLGIYQGTDIPADGAYTARITSDVAIAAIVNEVAPPSGGGQQSTAYNTLTAGAASVHLPIVESSGPDGFSTGQGVMNTGTVPTTVTVTYYDTASGAPIGTAQQSPSLQPNAFWGLYQPSGGLASGTRATAVVTTSSGGQVAVVCNESSPSALMSYVGQ